MFTPLTMSAKATCSTPPLSDNHSCYSRCSIDRKTGIQFIGTIRISVSSNVISDIRCIRADRCCIGSDVCRIRTDVTGIGADITRVGGMFVLFVEMFPALVLISLVLVAMFVVLVLIAVVFAAMSALSSKLDRSTVVEEPSSISICRTLLPFKVAPVRFWLSVFTPLTMSAKATCSTPPLSVISRFAPLTAKPVFNSLVLSQISVSSNVISDIRCIRADRCCIGSDVCRIRTDVTGIGADITRIGGDVRAVR